MAAGSLSNILFETCTFAPSNKATYLLIYFRFVFEIHKIDGNDDRNNEIYDIKYF